MIKYLQANLIDVLLAITFGCGVGIAMIHVLNRKFIAPNCDVILSLLAFTAATTASSILQHWVPAVLAFCAVIAWVILAVRTARTPKELRIGQTG